MTLFHLYLRWYLGHHFHGLRILNAERFPTSVRGPLVIYLNHPSWWDPLTCILISRRFLPQCDHYAPMDEAALGRYGFFRKLGLFPVEMETVRGAMQFVRYSREIVSSANSVLWMTPEGRFTDPRTRPPALKDGLASLLTRLPQTTVLPLAVEYVFWDERLPEILVNCGGPIRAWEGERHDKAGWQAALGGALTAAQDELAVCAMARDASRFETILEGGAGIGAIYDLWRKLRATAHGERYEAEHGSIHRS